MIKQILLLFTGLLGLFFFIYIKLLSGSISTTPISINQVATGTLPITSTFISPSLTNADYPAMFKEMKSVGIDTVIVSISQVIANDCGENFKDSYFLDDPSGGYATIIRQALVANMKVFFGPIGQDAGNYECFSPLVGGSTNTKTPMGHLINHFIVSTDKLKVFLANEGISWTDSRVAGLYIPEEIPTHLLTDKNPGNITYFKEISSRAKVYGKPLMISPAQSEGTSYDLSLQAFKNIIGKTDITIIAPQDSIGTGLTKTIAASTNHFKALYDAKAAFPSKNVEAWANIELFQSPGQDPTFKPDFPLNPPPFIPAPFSRVQQQIEAARPYVSKMTSWIYEYNMMILPAANNLYATNGFLGWQKMYTPSSATRRAQLRADYLAAYGGVIPTTPTPTPKPSIASTAIPGDLSPTGDTPTDQVNIFDYNLLVSKFGNPYTIFDYNKLVANFGK